MIESVKIRRELPATPASKVEDALLLEPKK